MNTYFLFRLEPFDEIHLSYDVNGKLCQSPTTNITEKVCTEDEIEYKVKQQVFVDHCIMDTTDAALSSQLDTKSSQDIFVNKGPHCHLTEKNIFCQMALCFFSFYKGSTI